MIRLSLSTVAAAVATAARAEYLPRVLHANDPPGRVAPINAHATDAHDLGPDLAGVPAARLSKQPPAFAPAADCRITV